MPCIGKRTLLLAPIAGRAEEPKTPAADMPLPSQEPAAMVEEIATNATEVSNFLRSLYTQYVPGHEIKEIQKDLPELSDR
jgi:hypothetical protein